MKIKTKSGESNSLSPRVTTVKGKHELPSCAASKFKPMISPRGLNPLTTSEDHKKGNTISTKSQPPQSTIQPHK